MQRFLPRNVFENYNFFFGEKDDWKMDQTFRRSAIYLD